MLVDLARNDLGRVCAPGTVEVAEFGASSGTATSCTSSRPSPARSQPTATPSTCSTPRSRPARSPGRRRCARWRSSRRSNRPGAALYAGAVGYFDSAATWTWRSRSAPRVMPEGALRAGRRRHRGRLRPGGRGAGDPAQGRARCCRRSPPAEDDAELDVNPTGVAGDHGRRRGAAVACALVLVAGGQSRATADRRRRPPLPPVYELAGDRPAPWSRPPCVAAGRRGRSGCHARGWRASSACSRRRPARAGSSGLRALACCAGRRAARRDSGSQRDGHSPTSDGSRPGRGWLSLAGSLASPPGCSPVRAPGGGRPWAALRRPARPRPRRPVQAAPKPAGPGCWRLEALDRGEDPTDGPGRDVCGTSAGRRHTPTRPGPGRRG